MEKFQNIFCRPLFIILFRAKILFSGPYFILNGHTKVESVAYLVLIQNHMITELLPEQILPKLILVHCATCTCLSTKRLRNFYDFFHFLLLALAYMYLPSTLYVPSSEFSVFQDCPWAIFFLFIFKDNKAPWKWVGFVR